jgi:DNA-binding CsgD family transcriptional regulator/tetratricopeptide (TPR) repeat protein
MPTVPRWDHGPLVGRDEELARLLAAVQRAAAGRGAGVLLAGDAGVGKTRLLDELAARATAGGLRLLVGHCVDLGDVGLPYLPFVDLLRPLAADPDTAPAALSRPALAALLAGRAEVLPVREEDRPGGDPVDRVLRPPGDDGRLQLFESVAALLAEVAAATPLLVVLEDVHWADRSSRDLLRYLFARLADEPVAVVASYRSDDLHRRHPLRPLLAELVRLPGVERSELAPLPDPAVAQLVRDRAAGDGGLPDATVDDVVARAEGNAFYAEELLAAALAGEQLPGGLADVLLSRVEQLPPGAQQVLRVAAVAGRRVRHELVAAVAGLDPAALEAALAEAVHAHLLVVTGDGRYAYRHALLREAVLADLLPGARVRLHAAVAAHLAAVPSAGTAAERAYHARESNDLPVALAASLEAAEQARRVGAPAEQLQHLETALALWPVVPDAAERTGRDQVSLLVDAAAAARRGGELQRATALLRAALDALGADGDAAARARVHYTLAQLATRVGDVRAALEHSATALDLVPAEPPSEVRAWALATRVRACYAADRTEEAERAATEALAVADALGLDSAWADTAMSLLQLRPGHLAAGERLHEALARARRSGDAEVEMRAWYLIAASAHEDGRLPEALAASDEGLRRAAELGVEWSAYAAEVRHLAVVARYAAGHWDGSLALAEQMARVPDMAAHVRAASLMVLVGRGDPAAAGRLAWARGLADRLDGHVLLLLATAAAEVDLAAQAGDAAAAAAAAVRAARRIEQLWGDDRLAVVRLVTCALAAVADAAAEARLLGDRDAAARWVGSGEELVAAGRAAWDAFPAWLGPVGVEGRAWAARLDAEADRLRGEDDAAAWRAVVAAFDYGHVPETARARLRLAAALLAADERDAAAGELRAAHAAATELGATPLREAVVALARRARLETGLPGARPVDPDAVLTPREQEVLGLLAQGRTNRQIGAALYISEKTASVHVSNILAKLGAGGRTEAVALAAERGLLPLGAGG